MVASHSCLLDSACTGSNVPYPSKFSLLTDTSSGSLIIHKLDRNDSDNYHCTVSSTTVETNPGSTSMQVTPLSPGIVFSIMNLHSKHQGKYINVNVNSLCMSVFCGLKSQSNVCFVYC